MLRLQTALLILSICIVGVASQNDTFLGKASQNTTSLDAGSQNATSFSRWNESKVAIFIDIRASNKIIPLILHSAGVLGDDWPFHIFYSAQNLPMYESSPLFMRHVKSGRFKMTLIPSHYRLVESDQYSLFMKQRSTWEVLAPAINVLIIQLDSIPCGNSPHKVEDFFEYDMVGSPITWCPMCINAGWSLRKRESMLRVIDTVPANVGDPREDQWFWYNIGEIKEFKRPGPEVSTNFGTESVFNSKSCGYHKPWVWKNDPAHMNEIVANCPEVHLIM